MTDTISTSEINSKATSGTAPGAAQPPSVGDRPDQAVPASPAAARAPRLPDSQLRPLVAGERACSICGIGVATPLAKNISTWDAYPPPRPGDVGEHTYPARLVRIVLTRCEQCEQVHERAAQAIAAIYDGPGRVDQAVWRLECALGALAALGARVPRLEDKAVRKRLTEHLTIPGGAARFSAQYLPVVRIERDQCATQPWSHLTSAQRQALRDGYAGMLRAQIEVPTPIRPPEASKGEHHAGCMLCGTGTWVALPSHAADIWTKVTIKPSDVGGRPGPERITGHLCPDCERAHQRVGSIGPSLLDEAVATWLGLPRTAPEAPVIAGLKAWCALPPPSSAARTANFEPWAHLGDRDKLRARLLAEGI